MDVTRQSLLLRAQGGAEEAWQDLADLYRPLILGWLRRHGVPGNDVDDLSQAIDRGPELVQTQPTGLFGVVLDPLAGLDGRQDVQVLVDEVGECGHGKTPCEACRPAVQGNQRDGRARRPGARALSGR